MNIAENFLSKQEQMENAAFVKEQEEIQRSKENEHRTLAGEEQLPAPEQEKIESLRVR